jgi:hypothetical protein
LQFSSLNLLILLPFWEILFIYTKANIRLFQPDLD